MTEDPVLVWLVHGSAVEHRMDKWGGSTVLYGKDVRTKTNKAEYHTYDTDEFFISAKMHPGLPDCRPPPSHVQRTKTRKHSVRRRCLARP